MTQTKHPMDKEEKNVLTLRSPIIPHKWQIPFGSNIYYGLESMPLLQVELVYPEACWVLRFPLQNQLLFPQGWGTVCCCLASLCLAWGSPMVQSCSHPMGQAHPRAREAAMQRPDCFPWLETSVRPARPQPHLILHFEGCLLRLTPVL